MAWDAAAKAPCRTGEVGAKVSRVPVVEEAARREARPDRAAQEADGAAEARRIVGVSSGGPARAEGGRARAAAARRGLQSVCCRRRMRLLILAEPMGTGRGKVGFRGAGAAGRWAAGSRTQTSAPAGRYIGGKGYAASCGGGGLVAEKVPWRSPRCPAGVADPENREGGNRACYPSKARVTRLVSRGKDRECES